MTSIGRQIRDSAAWKRLRASVLAESDVCHLCGHGGASDADHVIPVVERPDLALERENIRPAHGTRACPTCGARCNLSKGAGPAVTRPAIVCRFHGTTCGGSHSRDW